MRLRERYKPRRVDANKIPDIEEEGGWWDEQGVYVLENVSRKEAIAIAFHEMLEKFFVEELKVPEDKAHRLAGVVERLLFIWLGKEYFDRWWAWR